MSSIATRPLTLLNVDFDDLYARHLCRHSQLGINIVHLLALVGVWLGVYALVLELTHLVWLNLVLAIGYIMLVAVNAPPRIIVATGLFMALFVTLVAWVPHLPLWVYPLIIIVCYQIQSFSHKVFTKATDMTEFNERYPKGRVLFVVLLVYEVPMLLQYLCFDWKRWSR
jgi:hypothetical protein